MTKISACFITWNEEDLIAQAIENAWKYADEVMVVDTGSEDETVAKAQAMGATVYTGEDRYHKAQARNMAIEKSGGDWVVIHDCDELVADPNGLRDFLCETDAQSVYIKLSYMNGVNEPTLSYQQMRCWRRDAFRYQYRAHEVPVAVNGWGKSVHTDFVWEHRPLPDRKWKTEYTLARLLMDVQENPGVARPLYYLGRQYYYAQAWAKTVETLDKYMALSGGRDIADAHLLLSRAWNQLGDGVKRIQHLHLACAATPTRRDWWGELAAIYHADGKYALATGLLKCALEIEMPKRDYVTQYWYGAHIHDLLARCLWKLERYEEGHAQAMEALQLSPDNNRLVDNLGWFERKLKPETMDEFYTRYGAEVHTNRPRHKVIADLVEGPAMLDFGCGTGDLLLLLQEMYPTWSLYGTDKSDVALDMAVKRGVTANFGLDNSVPTTDLLDTIVVSQVLEHVDDDAVLVADLAECLRPGSLMIATVPREDRIPAPDHKREYTEDSLRELLSTVGEVEIRPELSEHRILALVRVQ